MLKIMAGMMSEAMGGEAPPAHADAAQDARPIPSDLRRGFQNRSVVPSVVRLYSRVGRIGRQLLAILQRGVLQGAGD